ADPTAEDYIFEFICLTHPHEDHLKGMLPILEAYCADNVPVKNRPRRFWDCGFLSNHLILHIRKAMRVLNLSLV
ncbi:MAG: hypothetical protein ACK2TV_05160, partial [Anaerolineales bacterium]